MSQSYKISLTAATHLAVIPRLTRPHICSKQQKGLPTWEQGYLISFSPTFVPYNARVESEVSPFLQSKWWYKMVTQIVNLMITQMVIQMINQTVTQVIAWLVNQMITLMTNWTITQITTWMIAQMNI